MTPEEFHSLYQEKFVPIYARLVAFSNEKPQQILIELSNILAHTIQTYNPDLDKEAKDKNYDKAGNHLTRITLDCHKLLLAYLDEKLEHLIIKDDKKRLAFNKGLSDVLESYRDFKNKAYEARLYEEKNIGIDTNGTISRYADAFNLGYDLFDSFDESKLAAINWWNRQVSVGVFVIGILASIVGSGILTLIATLTKNTPLK